MSTTLSRRTRTGSALASISGFAAAWMAMMATRYFALSADDINGGIGIGVDEGSWLSTAYSACEPIGVILGCWLSIGLSIRRVLLASVAVFIVAMLLPVVAPGFMILLISRALTGLAAGGLTLDGLFPPDLSRYHARSSETVVHSGSVTGSLSQ